MTPEVLPGEVWRDVLDGRGVAIVRRLVLRAVEWRDGEWLYLWDEDAAGVFRAWGEVVTVERDAARGVAQLAAEERDALRAAVAALRERLALAEARTAVPPLSAAELDAAPVEAARMAREARDSGRRGQGYPSFAGAWRRELAALTDEQRAAVEAAHEEGHAARVAEPAYDIEADPGAIPFGWGVGTTSRESGGEDDGR